MTEGEGSESLWDLQGVGFSSKKKELVRPVVPAVNITVNGKSLELPKVPVRSTNENGVVGYNNYEVSYAIPSDANGIPVISASSNNPAVKVAVTQAISTTGKGIVEFDYNGVVKTYQIVFTGK